MKSGLIFPILIGLFAAPHLLACSDDGGTTAANDGTAGSGTDPATDPDTDSDPATDPATDADPDAATDSATDSATDAATDSDPDPDPEYAYSACDGNERVGGFTVALVQNGIPEPHTSLVGRVDDAVMSTAKTDTLMTVGECSLLQGRTFFCDPACDVGEECGEGDQCVPAPGTVDMGTVSIDGLSAGPVVMEARPPRFNYNTGASLGYPGFEEGAAITLEAAGSEGPALSLRAEGVAPLVLLEEDVPLASGQAVTLTWEPPAEPGRSRVLVSLNINLHGSEPVRVECDAEDDGSLEIEAELVDALLASEYSGFPAVTLIRQTAEATDGADGCIDLRVRATLPRHPVQVEGVTSCNELQPECPDGESCNFELMLCE